MVLRQATSTLAGSWRKVWASSRMSSEKVAEKSGALLLLGHHREDLADVADEAHVEHAIGFVEDENLDCREIDGTLLHVVEQAPRGRDQNVDARARA